MFDEIQAIKSLIENNKRTLDAKVWKIEKKVSSSAINLKKIEETIDELNTNIQDVLCMVEVNSNRISSVEEKSYNLGLSLKAIENRISRRFHAIEERLGMTCKISSRAANPSSEGLEQMRSDIVQLQHSASADRTEVCSIKATLNQLTNKLDSTIIDLQNSTIPMDELAPRVSQTFLDKSMGIVRLGIERYILQIKQLINLEVSSENPDLKLIEKCNNVDVQKISKAISKAVSNCGTALEKYIKLPGASAEYVDQVSTTLVEASEWWLRIEALYAKMEIHSIDNSKGDTSDLGIFTDNVGKSVYEFLEDLEMAFLGWGNNKQKGAKVFKNHLSESIKAKVMHLGDDYIGIKAWLVKHYSDASRIVDDTIASLSKKKKPNPTNKKDRYTFYSDIDIALLRLERVRSGVSSSSVSTGWLLIL